MDLRGLYYLKKKDKFYVRFPSKKGVIDGEVCQYLIFSFCNPANQLALRKALQKALREFSQTEDYVSYKKSCKNPELQEPFNNI